jgi:hypothetical protein
MGLEIYPSLSISFQYNLPITDYLILKINRSVVEDSDVKIDPRLHSVFEITRDPLGELEPLIGRLFLRKMDGYIDITKIISLQKGSKDIGEVDIIKSRQDEANALQDFTFIHFDDPYNSPPFQMIRLSQKIDTFESIRLKWYYQVTSFQLIPILSLFFMMGS